MEGFILHILRVFRSETRLTVYRALYIIQKRFGGAKRRFCQRLSANWTPENAKLKGKVIVQCPNVLIKFLIV